MLENRFKIGVEFEPKKLICWPTLYCVGDRLLPCGLPVPRRKVRGKADLSSRIAASLFLLTVCSMFMKFGPNPKNL